MKELEQILKINRLVSIELQHNNGEVKRYSSRVENLDSKAIYLASPIVKRMPVYLPPQTEISVLLWDDLAVYSFKTTVIYSLKEKEVNQLAVRYPEKLNKVQKREFVRVQVSINVSLEYVDSENNVRIIAGKSRDLSGGGMSVAVTEKGLLEMGDKVTVKFNIGDIPIVCTAEIVRARRETDAENIARDVFGLKFLEIVEKERQIIIKFIYKKQIEFRRKGLL